MILSKFFKILFLLFLDFFNRDISLLGHKKTDLFLCGASSVKNTRDLTCANYKYAVTKLNQNVKVFTYEDYGNALFLLLGRRL